MKLLYFIQIFYILISAVLNPVSAVITLQLPGLTYATGTPTTVDVDFLDNDSKPIFTLKGEVFVQTLPMQSNNKYEPDKLTGGQKFVNKIRIKAGESGMVLKLFDTELSTVPKLMILMKAGFLASRDAKEIEIDFLDGEDHQTIGEAEINWYNRDRDEFKRMKGMHVGKLEIHVERIEKQQLMPVKSFGIVSFKSNEILMPEAMNAAIQEPSMIQAQNAVYVPASRYPNMYQQYPSFSQFPNAPQYGQ